MTKDCKLDKRLQTGQKNANWTKTLFLEHEREAYQWCFL